MMMMQEGRGRESTEKDKTDRVKEEEKWNDNDAAVMSCMPCPPNSRIPPAILFSADVHHPESSLRDAVGLSR